MARARAATACVSTGLRRLWQGVAGHLRQKPSRHHHQPAQRHRGQGRDLRFQVELLHALLQPRLQFIGAAARLLRVEAGVGPASLLLQLEFLGAVVPVADLFGEPILDRRTGLVDPPQTPPTDLLEMVRAPPARWRAQPPFAPGHG